MIPLIIGASIALVVTKTRPSTVVRVIEDSAMHVARSAKGLVRSTKIEYRARMYAKALDAIHKADAKFEGMTPAERKQAVKDESEILARSAEIAAARNKHRRSSSVGRKASV